MRRADHSFIVVCGSDRTRAVCYAQMDISVLQVLKLIFKVVCSISVLLINLWQLDSFALELLRCKFLVDQIVYFSFTFERRRNGKILLHWWCVEAIIHDILLGIRCFIRIDSMVFHAQASFISCLFRSPVLALVSRTEQVHRPESHSTIVILAITVIIVLGSFIIVKKLLSPIVMLMPSVWSVHIACRVKVNHSLPLIIIEIFLFPSRTMPLFPFLLLLLFSYPFPVLGGHCFLISVVAILVALTLLSFFLLADEEARARVALEVVPGPLARGQLTSALVLLLQLQLLLSGGFLLLALVGEEVGERVAGGVGG